jgi:uncharacterized membrane-anchored protein YhcB (DUF1043 family)
MENLIMNTLIAIIFIVLILQNLKIKKTNNQLNKHILKNNDKFNNIEFTLIQHFNSVKTIEKLCFMNRNSLTKVYDELYNYYSSIQDIENPNEISNKEINEEIKIKFKATNKYFFELMLNDENFKKERRYAIKRIKRRNNTNSRTSK